MREPSLPRIRRAASQSRRPRRRSVVPALLGLGCALWLWAGCPECLSADAMFYRVVSTHTTRILSLDSEGLLLWSNVPPYASCRIQSLSSVGGQLPAGSLTAPIECSGTYMSVRMPLRPVFTPVVLWIYDDGWGNLVEIRAVPAGESTTMRIQEANPYSQPPLYYAYAFADNCYTKLYTFTNNQPVFISTDPVPARPFVMTGTIFGKQPFYGPHYLQSNSLSITNPLGMVTSSTTDLFGRYLFTNTVLGTYTVGFNYQGYPFSFQVTNSPGTSYRDFFFLDQIVAMEPNIYLYPQTETNVQVTLAIPNGGCVSASAPPYADGWRVGVDTNGIIDGQYEYLFYEARVSRPLDSSAGWVLDGSDLDGAFRDLLSRLGFVGREIDDFVAYWVPIMQGAPWYAVYWQDAAATSSLQITPQPQSILRAHFVVRPLEQPIAIPAPAIPPFQRDGFTVVEWGVLGWEL